jgi:gamma-glutamylaminecyclotransferase
MSEIRHCVFVYGTLRRGGSNHHRMAGATLIGPATVRGYLYRIDWYPALVIDSNGREVVGEVYEVGESQLADLDAYEGDEYRRIQIEVSTEKPVWVWEWIGAPPKEGYLPNGDWLA